MKTRPMKHQIEGCRRLAEHPQYYALGCEQGTGKTWMLLSDAEKQYNELKITGLLVVAPKGVHINWVRREIPKHMSIEYLSEFWLSGATKKHAARLERLLRHDPVDGLAILSINVDAVNTKNGFAYVMKFLNTFKTMMVIDESQRIKNTSAKRTKQIHSVTALTVSRRIASGTLVANSPLDLFGQYQFLYNGLLGTRSFRAFTAEFAELLSPNHPMVQQIRSRARGNPQIVKRDREGRPVYRNLDKLRELMAPYTYRVTKEECLDLPPKIYQVHPFELTHSQRNLYNTVKEEKRFLRADGEIDLFSALTMINKLRQITSGFILVDGKATELSEAGPRMDALKEIVEDCEGKIIIWASFREELRQISTMLMEYGVVEYHGGTKTKDRDIAIDSFQNGEARIFVANPAAGGVGLTLTAASTVIYYSCSYSLEERLQSEDRAHRIGTHHPVLYIDLVAVDTIDEKIAASLQSKEEIASAILEGI